MSVYGHDDGFNKIEVPSLNEFNVVYDKENKLTKASGVLPTDCNTLKDNGIYYVTSLTANIPEQLTDYTLFVLTATESKSFVMQMALTKDSKSLYFRTFTDASWTAWKLYLSMDRYNEEKIKTNVDIGALDPTQIITMESLLMVKTNDGKKITVDDFTSMILNTLTYSVLDTESKTPIAAINDLNTRVTALEAQIPPLADDVVFPEVSDE